MSRKSKAGNGHSWLHGFMRVLVGVPAEEEAGVFVQRKDNQKSGDSNARDSGAEDQIDDRRGRTVQYGKQRRLAVRRIVRLSLR